MSSHQHDFMFDVNFSFGEESVFTTFTEVGEGPPPASNDFLLLDGSSLLLLDGEHLTLL